jgi:16S rRNA (adenine1518-N6/adenine1519-N6)-dimethyltransferase
MLPAKKHFGQHFLRDKNLLQKIVRDSGVPEGSTVLEIGPGEGTLTETLLENHNVVAIEKDRDLFDHLEKTFSEHIAKGTLRLVHSSILDYDLSTLGDYSVVANIPYNITGQIMRYLLQTENQPDSLHVVIQREVAERIVVQNSTSKHSLLSLSVQCYGDTSIGFHINKSAFVPPPKVTSSLLHVTNISKKYFENFDEECFFGLVKGAFSQKRKTFLSSIDTNYREDLKALLEDQNIETTVRPEDILLGQWQKITQTYCHNQRL